MCKSHDGQEAACDSTPQLKNTVSSIQMPCSKIKLSDLRVIVINTSNLEICSVAVLKFVIRFKELAVGRDSRQV